jgi:hypothetical protein
MNLDLPHDLPAPMARAADTRTFSLKRYVYTICTCATHTAQAAAQHAHFHL